MKAMISSTALDLPEHRKQAVDPCLRTRFSPIPMEYFTTHNVLNFIDLGSNHNRTMKGQSTMANVFISHRSADTALAEKLAIEIRMASHTVWLDTWEIAIGDQIVEKMNEGLTGPTYLVLCYSALGMAPWMNIEWTSTLARQLNGEGVKILPARLSGNDSPAILAGTKYADLIQNWSQGVADILQAIK
jgi:hypothetical protein